MNESRLRLGDYSKCEGPVLSVLVPAYKSNKYLFRAVDSVLRQTTEMQYEIVVVIDSPNANLDEIIDRYKNVENFYLYQNRENIGIASNSNRCVMLARGMYVAFLHDDDYLLPNYFEVMHKYLSKKEIKCLITGRFIEFLKVPQSELIKKYIRKLFFLPDFYRGKIQKVYVEDSLRAGRNIYFAPSCGTLFLKKAFLQLGGFDESIGMAFDIHFFLQFNMVYDIYETSEICSVYRVGNNTSMRSEVKYDFFNYFRTMFIDFYKDRGIETEYLRKYKRYLIYDIYKRLRDGLDKELEVRGEYVESVELTKWVAYRVMTLLYYWRRNLDIQRLR